MLGPDALGGSPQRVEAATDRRPAEKLDVLRRAVAGNERVEIEYYAASTAETTTRRVDPEEVFFAIGNWYVAAWDHLSGEERLFRADRIDRITPTGERFEPRELEGAGPAALHPRRRRRRPSAWHYARAPVGSPSTTRRAPKPNGTTAPRGRPARGHASSGSAGSSCAWGTDATVLDPPELKDRVRELASRTLERYE